MLHMNAHFSHESYRTVAIVAPTVGIIFGISSVLPTCPILGKPQRVETKLLLLVTQM